MAVVADAGRAPPERPKAPTRRDLTRELARRLRASQSDDDAADVLEAVVELARTPED
jgi:hypothetical protein